jgi:class 3 adenylate cyclase
MNALSSANTSRRLAADARLHEMNLTLLLSDVVGFSEMTDRLGDREAYHVIQRHHGVVRTELAAHGGEEVELRGDGFYLAFARPVPALRCAIAIQRDFALDARLHPEQPIRVRMGLHTGNVLHDPNVYFGKTVIESARIADQARGGEILVSAVFRRLVEAYTDVPFDAGRDVELRGLQGRQQVFSVTWDSQDRAAPAHDGAEHTPRRAIRLALLAQCARA